MRLWRIAAETKTYPATDLTGGGPAKNPGRWNDRNESVIYAAPSISIAALETAAHIDDTGFPLNRYLIDLDVPYDVWKMREKFGLAALPPTWSAIPAGNASMKIGSRWLMSLRSPILLVPSVVVPEEQAALINPLHPESK